MNNRRFSPTLEGCRILVVEDEFVVTLFLEEIVEQCGAETVGPAANTEAALALLSDGRIDAALLDVRLGHGDSFAVADRLAADGVPFGFVTGYGAKETMGPYAGRPRVDKPFGADEIRRLLEALVSGEAGAC